MLRRLQKKNNEAVTKLARREKEHSKSQGQEIIRKTRESNTLHRQYLTKIKEADVDYEQQNKWLKVTRQKS